MAFTFFFRDWHVLEQAANLLVQDFAGSKAPRIWDAGCAMGQEPYTLLMLLAERMSPAEFNGLSIDATDLDEELGNFGTTLIDGRYPYNLLKRIPEELFARYFVAEAEEEIYRVTQSLRDRIRFRKHDLLCMRAPDTGYEMIVCKNVLLHFNEEQRKQVIQMFYDALTPNGLLVMEQTQRMVSEHSDKFERVACDVQIYRKVTRDAASAIPLQPGLEHVPQEIESMAA